MKLKIYVILIVCTNVLLGQLGLGIKNPTPSAALHVTNEGIPNKGVLLSPMTTAQRDAITNPTDGLLIYNVLEKCFNYYNSNKWQSLCGEVQPASVLDIGLSSNNCSDIILKGDYTQGVSLNSGHYIDLPINITSEGTLSITATTGNGYSFSYQANLINVGNHTVRLLGNGIPSQSSDSKGSSDQVKFVINGIEQTCPKEIIVANNIEPKRFTVISNGNSINGNYIVNTSLNNSNTISVTIRNTDLLNPTPYFIFTNASNGITFSATGTLAPGVETIIVLLGSGTPTISGIIPLTISSNSTIETTNIPININVLQTDLGLWTRPATSCLEIYNKDNTAKDGMYFISGSNDRATKTYCDMTNGGWTLVWSRSEKTDQNKTDWSGLAFPGSFSSITNPINESQATNETTSISSRVNPIEFRLPLAIMRNISSFDTTEDKYRVRIVHDQNNVFNNNDEWANNNFIEINTSNYNTPQGYLLSGGAIGQIGLNTKGKLFTKDFELKRITEGAIDSNINVFIDGINSTNGLPANGVDQGWWIKYDNGNSIGDVLSLKGAGDYVNYTQNSGNINYTFEGRNLVTRPNDWNDLFRGYGGEAQQNHHWGKCNTTNITNNVVGTGDDYLGVSTCDYSLLSPHSFNGGEGRIMQWFIK